MQAACELGVDEIVPWQASRSVSRWEGPKAAKGRERWATIVREAAKQAHRAWLPDVVAPVSTTQLAERAREQRVLLLDPTAPVRLSEIEPDDRDLVLVVGPEGGISEEELRRLTDGGGRTRAPRGHGAAHLDGGTCRDRRAVGRARAMVTAPRAHDDGLTAAGSLWSVDLSA